QGSWQYATDWHNCESAPTATTLLDRLAAEGHPVIAIGKVNDLFAGRGVGEAVPTRSDEDGMDAVAAQMDAMDRGLLFANLVDFDTVYGHRNDVAGYARNLERFDARLAGLLPRPRAGRLLIGTAGHRHH